MVVTMARLKIGKPLAFLLIGLGLVFAFSFLANRFQTDWGRVRIIETTIPMERGETLSAYIFKPASATKDDPAPCVVTAHGGANNKEMQDMASIELSRRGYVVIAIDLLDHGKSSGTAEGISYTHALRYQGAGMIEAVEYAYNNLAYVDKDKIGITGHSNGGRATSFTLDEYGRYAKIKNGESGEGVEFWGQPIEPSHALKVASALIVSNVPPAAVVNNFPESVDIGLLNGYYDESIKSSSQTTPVEGYDDCDFTVVPEGKNFINQGVPGTFAGQVEIEYPDSEDFVQTFSGYDPNEKVELDHWYEDDETGSRRIIYNPKIGHAAAHFDPAAAAALVSFFGDSMGYPIEVSDTTTYLIKEVCNLIALIGLFVFGYGVILCMLEMPLFASLHGAVPAALAVPDAADKRRVAINLAILTALGCVLVLPGMLIGNAVLPKLIPAMNMATGMMATYAALMGVVSIIVFLANWRLFDRKRGASMQSWGLAISRGDLGKTALFSMLLFAVFYGLVALVYWLFQTDFRFWIFAIKTIKSFDLAYLLAYLPFFLLYFFALGWTLTGSIRFTGVGRVASALLYIAEATGGMVLAVLIQYATLVITGHLAFSLGWVMWLWLINMIVVGVLGALLTKALFEKTGSIWLAVFVCSLLAAFITVGTTRIETFV